MGSQVIKTRSARKRKNRTGTDLSQPEVLPYTTPERHHHISTSLAFPVNLYSWLGSTDEDPSMKNFIPKLKNHLLERLMYPDEASMNRTFTLEEQADLMIHCDRVYQHKVLRVNYTSYDVRRCQDSLNPRTHADVMVLAPRYEGVESLDHPFLYARILGIFHTNVLRRAAGSTSGPLQRMEFLWVHWYRVDKRWKGGFKHRRFHRVELVPESDPGAFGFLDPDDVIRGVHFIPGFAHGRRAPVSGEDGEWEDVDTDQTDPERGVWRYFYVNFFVDRDMYMRYIGGGVGHCKISLPPDRPDPEPDGDGEGGTQAAKAGAEGESEEESDLASQTDESSESSSDAEDEDEDSVNSDKGSYLDPEAEERYAEL